MLWMTHVKNGIIVTYLRSNLPYRIKHYKKMFQAYSGFLETRFPSVVAKIIDSFYAFDPFLH